MTYTLMQCQKAWLFVFNTRYYTTTRPHSFRYITIMLYHLHLYIFAARVLPFIYRKLHRLISYLYMIIISRAVFTRYFHLSYFRLNISGLSRWRDIDDAISFTISPDLAQRFDISHYFISFDIRHTSIGASTLCCLSRKYLSYDFNMLYHTLLVSY